jgi:hypothetical protein
MIVGLRPFNFLEMLKNHSSINNENKTTLPRMMSLGSLALETLLLTPLTHTRTVHHIILSPSLYLGLCRRPLFAHFQSLSFWASFRKKYHSCRKSQILHWFKVLWTLRSSQCRYSARLRYWTWIVIFLNNSSGFWDICNDELLHRAGTSTLPLSELVKITYFVRSCYKVRLFHWEAGGCIH